MATVLVVDDDAGIRESASMALQKVGHRVLQASDAGEALRELRAHRVDVVVSDIYMPGDDGLTLLQAISERNDPPRVILMTARGTIETTALANASITRRVTTPGLSSPTASRSMRHTGITPMMLLVRKASSAARSWFTSIACGRNVMPARSASSMTTERVTPGRTLLLV